MHSVDTVEEIGFNMNVVKIQLNNSTFTRGLTLLIHKCIFISFKLVSIIQLRWERVLWISLAKSNHVLTFVNHAVLHNTRMLYSPCFASFIFCLCPKMFTLYTFMLIDTRFEVLLAMNIKITTCWSVTPCSLVGKYHHFLGMWCFQLEGRRWR